MEQLLTITKIAFGAFVPLSIYYILIKIVRTAILSTNRWINLDDINFILLASIIIALASFQNSMLIKILIFVPVLIYTLLLWIDAIIFYLYSFEINKRNLTEFLKDYKALISYSTKSRSNELIKRYPWILFALPLSLFMIMSIFFVSELPDVHVLVIPIVFIVSIFVLQKFSQSILRNIVLFTIIIIPNFIFSEQINFLIGGIPSLTIALLFCIILTIILFLNLIKKTANHTFFTISSHFRKFLRGNKLLQDSKIKIRKENNELIKPKSYNCTPTKYFGLLKGANVILIAVESLGFKYIKNNTKLRLPFMNKVASGATISKNHYAISPHTNQFLTHLFSSNYNLKNNYPFLELLHNSNYNTAFISSADINLWGTNELVQKIGFQKVEDRNSLGNINYPNGDYVLLNSVNKIKDLYKKPPCFIQILTQQSHYPYTVINKKQFNHYSHHGLKSKYFNSIEEADFVLESLFDELSNLIPLEDTLIIYTGDHGQSFGELGYKTH